MIRIRLLATFAAFSMIVAAAASPGQRAAGVGNGSGVHLNGLTLNGAKLNGTSFNGRAFNGRTFNGARLNGSTVDGSAGDGARSGGSAVSDTAVALPWEQRDTWQVRGIRLPIAR